MNLVVNLTALTPWLSDPLLHLAAPPAASKKLPSLFRAASGAYLARSARPLTTIRNRDTLLLPSLPFAMADVPSLLPSVSHSPKWLIGFAIHGRMFCLAGGAHHDFRPLAVPTRRQHYP